MTNSELRKRKVKEHNEKSIGLKRKKSKGASPNNIHTSLLCLIISGTILTTFLVLYTDQIPWHLTNRIVDDLAKKFLGHHKPVYAVVVDAGSTGSRVLAYSFHKSYFGDNLVLDKELFEQNKPGLSSFAKEPKKGAQRIADLLELAKKEIPKEHWNKTPIIMKATAGLRLLPQDQAENLLNAVKEVISKAPFMSDEHSVEIMDGTNEGIFSWFTVNFLLNRINLGPANTVAALDLGGGSTQVTFAAITPSSLQDKESIHRAESPSGQIPVFTHSYLGLGLMAGRQAALSHGNGDSYNVTSACVNPAVKGQRFHFNGHDYYVSGIQENYPTSKSLGVSKSVEEEWPIVDFVECSQIIENYVHKVSSLRKLPEELPMKTIFAFSYYTERASEVGLIDFKKGGRVKVADFKNHAAKVCHEPYAQRPFICLDMTFIWLLLEKGFGLGLDTTISLYNKIAGHEVSWALGAAYDVLRKTHLI